MLRGPRAQRRESDGSTLDRADLSQLRRLFVFVKPYRRYFAIAIVGVLVSSALGLVFPRIMGDLVDTALSGAEAGDTSQLDRIGILLLGVFFFQAAFNFLRIYFLTVMGEGVVADLRKAVYGHVMTLPVKFFDSRKTGEITSRLTSDVAVVQNTVSASLAQALAQGITLLGGLTLMVIVSPTLSLTVLSFLPIAIVSAAIFGRRLRKISREYQDRIAEANSYAEEAISSARVVKWFNAEAEETTRYSRAVAASYSVAMRRAKLRGLFTPFVTFVAFGTLAVVLWVGGRRVLAGALTAGELVTFLLYTLSVAGAIGTFTGLYGDVQQALGASSRIFELLDERNDLVIASSPVTLERVAGRVTFRNVWFSYDDREVEVLRGIDLDANPGDVIALVGPSGAGKSTLIQLIPRFFDPTGGSVELDGENLRNLDLISLRSHMAAVPQETQLFSGTIADNLRVGRPNATMDELETACIAANAHDFISAFPDAYDTIVGEKGVKLSGGQRQRVAIARALLKDPRILILDEATSSLDSESESLVQQALETLMHGRTTFVIAHRLSTVRSADRLLVIDDGKIVQEGTHVELLAAGGLYADLYARQFREDDEFID